MNKHLLSMKDFIFKRRDNIQLKKKRQHSWSIKKRFRMHDISTEILLNI